MKKEFDYEMNYLYQPHPEKIVYKFADECAYSNNPAWEVFDLITSTYYGKGMYFMEPSGVVFSRYSGAYFKDMNEALNEFLELIGDDGGC